MLSFSQKNIDEGRRVAGLPTRAPVLGALASVLGALWGTPAQAALSDTIHPFVAVTVSRDDNLFRRDDADPASGPRGDTIRQVQAGATFERPIGRQILSGQAKLSKVSFSQYDQLDYDGKDLLAALEWHLGNHVEGHVGASYAQTLTPFTDFQTDQRNLRVQRREYADAAWRFHPSWRVRGGVSEDRFEYDLESQRFNERNERAVELGLDYLASSGSRVGLQLRRINGDYAHKRFDGPTEIDAGYEQDEVKANVYWQFSGVTQVQFLGGWARRKHAFFTLRDSSGANGRVTVNWKPLGKVRFTASGWREFGAVENPYVNSSLNRGASLAAAWDVSAKVRADAQIRSEKRDFDTIDGIALAGDTTDTIRSASLGLNYQPVPAVQLGVNLTREMRSGAALIGTGNYTANGVSFNASVKF